MKAPMFRVGLIIPFLSLAVLRQTAASTFGVGDMVPASFYHPPSPPPPLDIHAPMMELEDMALALRFTGEINRRLQAVTSQQRRSLVDHSFAPAHGQYPLDPMRGGEAAPFRVASAGDEIVKTPLTAFHAKSPRQGDRKGAARWGPSLPKFLHTLVTILREEDSEEDLSLELALAMIYMDRACSVETPRSNGLAACPFCTPRTVHRLTVTAVLVAMESTRGNDAVEKLYPKVSDSLGIPEDQLRHMVDWMLGSLGDPGFFVDPFQMQEFTETWERRFNRQVESDVTEEVTQQYHHPHHHQQQPQQHSPDHFQSEPVSIHPHSPSSVDSGSQRVSPATTQFTYER